MSDIAYYSHQSKTDDTTTTTRLLTQFHKVRNTTKEITSTLAADDYVIQTAYFTSPVKWHLGHVSWMYEAIMGKLDHTYGFKLGELSKYLNSYYQQFGVPHDKGARGVVSRPTTQQILEYFESVNKKVESFLHEHKALDAHAVRLLDMGMHHECQHQELLVYDLQHLLADRYIPQKTRPFSKEIHTTPIAKSVSIPGGLYSLGYSKDNGYCYDIELPEHAVHLDDYCIDVFPVTNQDYLEFIKDGGYTTYKHWLSDGWDTVKKEGWGAPMYWEKIDDTWMKKDFAGYHKINPDEPVCHVSYFEASAYCKWAGKRLPTEAEWEKAACWDKHTKKKTVYPWGDTEPIDYTCNLLESNHWKCSEIGSYPQGASSYGCHQMIGDVWEWTSSEFTGYPRFKSGFDEYNDKWFANQKVLRGGSFATPRISIRGSYRNFFRLDERWMFCGFRCANDSFPSAV